MELISFDEVREFAEKISSQISQQEIVLINKRKREILTNPSQNISILLDFFNSQQISQKEFLFIMDLITEFTRKYFNSLPIDQICTFFINLGNDQIDSELKISKISDFISENLINYYVTSEEHWMIDFPEDISNISPLFLSTFHIFFDNFFDVFDPKDRDIISIFYSFLETYFPPLFQIANICFLQDIFPNYSISLLKAIFIFVSKLHAEYKYFDAKLEQPFELIRQALQEQQFIAKIMSLSKKDSIELLADISVCIYQKGYTEIYQQLYECISLIHSDPSNFDDMDIIHEYNNLLISMDTNAFPDALPSFILHLMTMISFFKEHDISKYFTVLFGISTFLVNSIKLVNTQPNALSIFQEMINLPSEQLEPFPEYIEEIESTISILCQIIGEELGGIIDGVGERINESFSMPLSHENDMSLAFCFLFIQSILKVHDKIQNKNALTTCIRLACIFIDKTNDHMNDINTSIGSSLMFEEQFISLLKQLIHVFFPQIILESQRGSVSELFNDMNPSEIARMIINRYMLDINFGISLHQTKQAIEELLKNQQAMNLICSTDFPSFFLTIFKNIPTHKIVFKTLSQLIFQSPQKAHLLAEISHDFEGDYDIDKLIYLLRMMSGLFDGSLTSQNWIEVNKFCTDNFKYVFNDVSNSECFRCLLHYIFLLLNSFPNDDPFSSKSKEGLNLIHDISRYLINISNHLSSIARPIQVELSFSQSIFSFSPIKANPTNQEQTQDGDDSNDIWTDLDKVAISANKLIRLPIVNIGIMKLYNDNSFLDLFIAIIDVIQKTPPVSLQCFPDTLSHVVEFINRIVFYYPNEIIHHELFPYILSFLKTVFLSKAPIDIDYACSILNIFSQNDLSVLRPHFIIAFNYVRNQIQISQFVLDFLFLMIDRDRDFFLGVADLIVNYAGENGPRIREILNLLTTDQPPINRFLAFVDNLNDFPILIDEVPSLAEYFVFTE